MLGFGLGLTLERTTTAAPAGRVILKGHGGDALYRVLRGRANGRSFALTGKVA